MTAFFYIFKKNFITSILSGIMLAAGIQMAMSGLCNAQESMEVAEGNNGPQVISTSAAGESFDIEEAQQENQRIKMNAELETQLSDTLGAGGFLMAFNSAVNMNYLYEPGASTEEYEEVWMRQKGDEGIYIGCNKAGYMMALEIFYSTDHYSLDPLKGKFMTTFKVLGISEEKIPQLERAFNDVMNTRESRIYDEDSNRTFICSRFMHWGDKQHYIIVIKAQKGDQTKHSVRMNEGN